MSKNILFIGAGASIGAREHLLNRIGPPSGIELLGFLRRCLNELCRATPMTEMHSICNTTLHSGLKLLNQYPDESEFETILPKLIRKDRETVHRVLQMLFSDSSCFGVKHFGFASGPDEYDRLIHKINITPSNWIIISLNYDLLFEEALKRANLAFYYPEIDKPKELAIPFFKPHGSINFFAKPDDSFSYSDERGEQGRLTRIRTSEFGDYFPEYPIVYSVPLGSKNVLYEACQDSGCFPIIANYTKGKNIDTNDRELRLVRKAALSLCKPQSNLLIVGVNPVINSNDDPFCSVFFQTKFQSVTDVDKGSKAGSILRKIYPHVILHTEGLISFLDSHG